MLANLLGVHIARALSVTLWTLAGFVDVIRCELAEAPAGFALGLCMGEDLILAELWPSAERARARADELRARLLSRGWILRDD